MLTRESKRTSQTDSGRYGAGHPLLSVRQIGRLLVSMAAVGIAIPVIVYLDMIVVFGRMSELSMTEGAQLLLLAISAALYAVGAHRIPEARGYLAMMATFSLLMCVRESDGHLDAVFQGFWTFPAAIATLLGGTIIWRNRTTFRAGLRLHLSSRYGMLVILGLFVLILFSRVFGSGELWRPIMAENYTMQIKGAIQEGLELLGYSIFAFGTVGSYATGFR